MTWIVDPYVGLSALRFGESGESAIRINGQPKKNKIFDGENKLLFGIEKPLVTLIENKIVEIGCHHDVSDDVIYNNINIFKDNAISVIKKIANMEKTVYERNGFIVFLNSGITLTGFHDGDMDQKAMTMFAKEYYWAGIIDKMTPFDTSKL